MGVNGLWTMIQPCARPTNLATLNRKRLAVDASIWIYQFLKAVRDKEGNALRNSHVVGFFRRICKLLWFGILPVFVFDGGAPTLKRATLRKRQQRREGRREDAVKTAGKLLAVQMQRAAAEEEQRRKREQDADVSTREAQMQLQDSVKTNDLVYLDEIGMSQAEKQKMRRFHKQDQYHLPELESGIASIGKPDDPRMMSIEELEDYARQFQSGEDLNLYDFSKIDFNGDFFKSLPALDRYNILNAARLRSRLRMGLSKDQLNDMFPDRMAFSRFQIERVKERNHLTQRLMIEAGMQGTYLTLAVNARIAGEKDREYILVQNEGAEGGWALGVVSKNKDLGEAHKPIDVDAIEVHYRPKEDSDDDDDGNDFEDVPIEGLNRLPKPKPPHDNDLHASRDIAPRENQPSRAQNKDDDEDSLFVGGNKGEMNKSLQSDWTEWMHPEEEDDIQRAIALSLKNQYFDVESYVEKICDELTEEPKWTQKPMETSKLIKESSGSVIAHVFNNRANAAMPKPSAGASGESDSDDDMQAVLAKCRRAKARQPKHADHNKPDAFGGPLPFPKLDWKSSIFTRKSAEKTELNEGQSRDMQGIAEMVDMAGGFEVDSGEQDGPRALPPWLADNKDIRESLMKQQIVEREINAEDRQEAEEKARLRNREMQSQAIEISYSDDDDDNDDSESDIHSAGMPHSSAHPEANDSTRTEAVNERARPLSGGNAAFPVPEASNETSWRPSPRNMNLSMASDTGGTPVTGQKKISASAEPNFEDVSAKELMPALSSVPRSDSPLLFGDEALAAPAGTDSSETPAQLQNPNRDDDSFADEKYEEFSDPEHQELLMQMAEEAEEHARFASELNQKSAAQNKEECARELRALRSQQKKDRRDADQVTQVMVTECQALLKLFGIPYITAPMEAEAQCAELVKLGIVDGIVTDDSDTFLFGGTRVYKNMFNGNKFVECYLGSDLEKEMSLSREQLISLAHLLGSDYTEGLPGVGPVTAVEILCEFPGKTGLEQFRDWWTAVQNQGRPKEADASSAFRKKFRKSQATKLFLPPGFPSPAVYDAYLHPEVDDSAEPFQWGVPDLEGLRQFLMSTIGWSKERTDEVLVPVIRDINRRDLEGTQSNITRFFGGSVGTGAQDAFAPQQRTRGSKRMAAAVNKLKANVTGGDAALATEAGPGQRRKRRRRNETAEGDE